MPNGASPLQDRKALLVKDIGDQAAILDQMDLLPVGTADPGGLLPPMLHGEEGIVGDLGGGLAAVDSNDGAHYFLLGRKSEE
jgi:hypothetical protein